MKKWTCSTILICTFLSSALAEETIEDIVDRHPSDPGAVRWSNEQALLVKEIESGESMGGYTLLTDLLEHPETKQLIEYLSDKLPDNSHTWDDMVKEPVEGRLKWLNRARRGHQLQLAVCHAMLQAAREKNSEEFLRLGRVAVNLTCSAVNASGQARHPYLRTLHSVLKHRWLSKEVVREVVVFARESNRTFNRNVKIFNAPYSKKQKATGFPDLHDIEFPNMLLFESLEALTAPDAEPCARLGDNLRKAFASSYEEKREKPLDFELDCSMEDGQLRFSFRFKEPVFLYQHEPWNPTFTFTGTDIALARSDGRVHSMFR